MHTEEDMSFVPAALIGCDAASRRSDVRKGGGGQITSAVGCPARAPGRNGLVPPGSPGPSVGRCGFDRARAGWMDHHAYHVQQRCVCQRVRAPHVCGPGRVRAGKGAGRGPEGDGTGRARAAAEREGRGGGGGGTARPPRRKAWNFPHRTTRAVPQGRHGGRAVDHEVRAARGARRALRPIARRARTHRSAEMRSAAGRRGGRARRALGFCERDKRRIACAPAALAGQGACDCPGSCRRHLTRGAPAVLLAPHPNHSHPPPRLRLGPPPVARSLNNDVPIAGAGGKKIFNRDASSMKTLLYSSDASAQPEGMAQPRQGKVRRSPVRVMALMATGRRRLHARHPAR